MELEDFVLAPGLSLEGLDAPKFFPKWPPPPKWPDARICATVTRRICEVQIRTRYTGRFFSYDWNSPDSHRVHTMPEAKDRETFLCVKVGEEIALSTWRGTWLTYDGDSDVFDGTAPAVGPFELFTLEPRDGLWAIKTAWPNPPVRWVSCCNQSGNVHGVGHVKEFELFEVFRTTRVVDSQVCS